MRALVLVLLTFSAIAAIAQPLRIARIDAPPVVASGEESPISLTVHVQNVSEGGLGATIEIMEGPVERARVSTPEAIPAESSESVPLRWVQSASVGMPVRLRIVLRTATGRFMERQDIELPVQASGSGRPVTPLPPSARDAVPTPQNPPLPGNASPRPPDISTTTIVQGTAPQTATPAPLAPRRNVVLEEEMRIRDIRHTSLARRAERDVTSCIIEIRIRNESAEDWGDDSFGYVVRTYYMDGDRAILTHEASRDGFVFWTEPLRPGTTRMFPITVRAPSGSELFQYGRRFRVEVMLRTDRRSDTEWSDNAIRAEGEVVDEGTLFGSSLRMEPETVVRLGG